MLLNRCLQPDCQEKPVMLDFQPDKNKAQQNIHDLGITSSHESYWLLRARAKQSYHYKVRPEIASPDSY